MRGWDSATRTRTAGRSVDAFTGVWITGINQATNLAESVGLWDNLGSYNASVIDGFTGAQTVRPFYGAGRMLNVSSIPGKTGLSVSDIAVALGTRDDVVDLYVRGYRLKGQPIQIYQFYPTVGTHTLVGSAYPIFVGLIDHVMVKTPEEGGTGVVNLTCVSNTRDLTRASGAIRSSHYSNLRHAGDDFGAYAGVAHEWDISWGQYRQKISSVTEAERRRLYED